MLPPKQKEFASPRITKSTSVVGYKDELPKARVREGVSQDRRDWTNLTMRVCVRNLHRVSCPLKRALLNGPLTILGCAAFWSTASYPSDLNDKIAGHGWRHPFNHINISGSFFCDIDKCDFLFYQSCKFQDLSLNLGVRRPCLHRFKHS